KNGMTEPTATILWKTLNSQHINPHEVALWNAFPWHPYDRRKGLLSNRTPKNSELIAGYPVLKSFLKIFNGAEVIAAERKCKQSLQALAISHNYVRHPANGGATKFRKQLKEIMNAKS